MNDVQFVTVIEPVGTLEAQVVLLIESLRRWGGRLSDRPFLCISPRFRPPLRASTRRRLSKLGATLIYRPFPGPYGWYSFLNKPLAMAAARKASRAERLVWLDADVMVLDEPTEWIGADIDFLACPVSKDVATEGPGDRFHPYWEAFCRVVGLEVDDLP